MASLVMIALPTLISLSGGGIFVIALCVVIAFFILIKSIPLDEEDKKKFNRYKQGLPAYDDENIIEATHNIVSRSALIINPATSKFGDLDFFVNSAFPNRQRIMQDSIAIINNTKNIDVLISRYDTLVDACQWIKEAKEHGFPVILSSTNNDFDSDLNWLINENLARLAKENYEKYLVEIYRLKTSRAIDNRTIAIFSILDKCKDFLKPHTSVETYQSIIENFHFLVEENYSTRVLGFPSSGGAKFLKKKGSSSRSMIKSLRKKINPPFFLKFNLKRRIEAIYSHISIIRTTLSLFDIKESSSTVYHHFKILKTFNAQNRIDFFDDDDFVNNFNQMINDNLVRISIDFCQKENDIIGSDRFIQSCIDYAKKAPNIGNTLSKLEGLIRSESPFTQMFNN